MKLNNINIVIFFLCSFFFSSDIMAHEIVKNVSQEYALQNNEKLILQNKYGHINIQTWDKQYAKIDVKITVNAKNKSKAEDLMEHIVINFDNGSNYVSAKTIIESNNDSWFNVQINYNTKYEIDYTVFMPKNALLEVTNKYGDTEVPSLDKDINAVIKYGKIHLDNQKGNVTLKLGYGNAKFKELGDLNAEIKYSDLKFEVANNVRLNTKYSKFILGKMNELRVESGYDDFYIDQVNTLKNDGKYDDWEIGSAKNVDFETKYSDIEIEFLGESGDFEQKYGDIEIDKIGPDAQDLRFEINYVDVIIKNISTGYTLDFDGSYSDCIIHEEFDFTLDSEDGNSENYKGSYGNGKTKITVEITYGDFNIR